MASAMFSSLDTISPMPTAVIPSLNGQGRPQQQQHRRNILPSFGSQSTSRLMQFVKGDEKKKNSVAEKEIKALVKKLSRTDALPELEKALSTDGGTPSRCVTIKRVLDGSEGRGQRMPHVIYCRLWRWPDLLSHLELKPAEICEFNFSSKKEEICINPYHYVRKTDPVLQPVFVPNGLHHISPPFLPQASPGDPPSVDTLPDEETPPPAYSEVASCVGSPPDHSVYSGVGSPLMSPQSFPPIGSPPVPQGSVVPYTPPPYWCSINYYEMSSRIGESFQAIPTVITVDGGTDTCTTERFCIGGRCNVSRDATTIQVRKHIGQGVRLIYSEGIVYMEVLSSQSVFVQALSANLRNSWHKATVVKVLPGCMMDMFDCQDFARRLADSVGLGFEAVNELQKLCIIRLSFVKGWGTEYRRPNVTATPCWIEIHLHGPLQWLDKVLTHMGGPGSAIHSDT